MKVKEVKIYNHDTEVYSYMDLEEFEYAFNNECISTFTHSMEFIYDDEEKQSCG